MSDRLVKSWKDSARSVVPLSQSPTLFMIIVSIVTFICMWFVSNYIVNQIDSSMESKYTSAISTTSSAFNIIPVTMIAIGIGFIIKWLIGDKNAR